MEQGVARGQQGGRRRRRVPLLRRPWLLLTRGAVSGAGHTTELASAEVKEAGSPYGARRPFTPAFSGVGVAPTLVVSRLPEYAVPPQQGAADIFPMAPSHQYSAGSNSSNSNSSSSRLLHQHLPIHHSTHHSGHSSGAATAATATTTDETYDSDASTVMSDMEGSMQGAGDHGSIDDGEDGEDGFEDDDMDDDAGSPPMPCAFGRTQRVYVEREAVVEEEKVVVGGRAAARRAVS